MNKVKVRCWRASQVTRNQNVEPSILISFPEDNWGHDLISCLECGAIYAIDITKEVYVGPRRDVKLDGLACIKCRSDLGKTSFPYPEKYRTKNGEIRTYIRPNFFPSDEESIIEEIDAIY